MTFHENLRKARLARGMTQEALGEKLGMAAQTISKWERGESLPDAALLPGLADLLGVSLDRLFERKTGTFEDAAEALQNCLTSIGMEDRWDAALRLCNVIGRSASGMLEMYDLLSLPWMEDLLLGDREASGGSMRSEGFCVYSRQKGEGLSFFTFFPRPAAGWAWAIGQDKPELWEALADGEVRKVLRTLYSAMLTSEPMDRSCLDQLLDSLELTDREGMLRTLEKLEVLKRRRILLDGRETEIFYIYTHVDLLQLLLLGNAGPWGSVHFGDKTEQEKKWEEKMRRKAEQERKGRQA